MTKKSDGDVLQPLEITRGVEHKPKTPPFYTTNTFRLAIALITFVCSLIGSGLLWFTDVYEISFLKGIGLRNGTDIFENWERPDMSNLVHLYFFNYTNAEEAFSGRAAPVVKELGPYIFREKTSRYNVTFDGVQEITFSENRTHEFLPELSKGRLDDNIATPNVPYIAAVNVASKSTYFRQLSISLLLNTLGSHPYVNVKAEQLAMGFDDAFSMANRNFFSKLERNAAPPRYGVLVTRTGESKERITIGTGVPDIYTYGIVQRVDDQTELNTWNSPECNSISGSDGFIFPGSLVSRSDRLFLFAKAACRRIPLQFTKEYESNRGYPIRRFTVPANSFATAEENSDNACYCQSQCLPSGTFSTAPCTFGSPVALSFPHFLYGDPQLRTDVVGLIPNETVHTWYFDIHKSVGIPLAGHSRYQINIVIHHAKHLSHLKNLKDGLILPLAWVDIEIGYEWGARSDALIEKANFVATTAQVTLRWTVTVMFLVSFVILLCFLKYFYANNSNCLTYDSPPK